MLYKDFVGSEKGLQMMGDMSKTGGALFSSLLSQGMRLALSASAMALISSKTGCAPRRVKTMLDVSYKS